MTKTCAPFSPSDAVTVVNEEFTRMSVTVDPEEEMYRAPPTREQLQDVKLIPVILRVFPEESSA